MHVLAFLKSKNGNSLFLKCPYIDQLEFSDIVRCLLEHKKKGFCGVIA